MQPMLTQTPPSLSFSTTATESPSCAARMAQTYPAGPPPMMITSNWLAIGRWSLVVGRWARSPHQGEWILEQGLERLQEGRARRAVDGAVVAAHGHPHLLPHRE